jgi:O-antigen/teichoic acid export membrane protein
VRGRENVAVGQGLGGGPVQDLGDTTAQQLDLDAPELGRRHVRGSALLVVGRVLALLINMATQVIIVRTLTKVDFGAFAFAFAFAAAGRTMLSLGQGRLLSRFMATYEEQRDYPRMFGAMLLALGTILATSVVGIGAVFLFSDQLLGSALRSSEAVDLVLILIFLSPLEAVDQVFISLFAVFSDSRAIFLRKYLVVPGIRLVVVVLLVLTGAGVHFLATGYVLGALLGILVYAYLFVLTLRQRGLLAKLRDEGIKVPYRAVFEFSFPLITGELAFLSLSVGGVFVLAMFHSAGAVADYRAVFGAARLNTAITTSFVTLFLPMIAKLYARHDFDGLRETYWHTGAFVAVLTFPIFALTGPLAPSTTVALFGQRYAGAAPILAILAVGYYANVMLGFNAYALQVYGRIRYLVVVNTVTAAGNIALCFVLAPRFGAVGVATANCVALVGQNLLNQIALRRTLRTGLIGRSCWSTYTAIALAAALLWGYQALASPGLVVSLATAACASVAVLLVGQRALRLADTFPELMRVPFLRRVVR